MHAASRIALPHKGRQSVKQRVLLVDNKGTTPHIVAAAAIACAQGLAREMP